MDLKETGDTMPLTKEQMQEMYDNSENPVKTKLSIIEFAYLEMLKENKGDKWRAYYETHSTTEMNAKKNYAGFDKKVKAKIPYEYNLLQEYNVKYRITPKERKYIEALKKNKFNRKAAACAVSNANDLTQVAVDIEKRLTAKNPEWRDQLQLTYNPNQYFESIDEIAKDETGIVNAETKRKAANDMLSYMGFSQVTIKDLDPERAGRSKHDKDIDRILALQVNIDTKKGEVDTKIIDVNRDGGSAK